MKEIMKLAIVFTLLSILNFLLLSFYSTTFDIKLWAEPTRVIFIFNDLFLCGFQSLLLIKYNK